MNQLEQQLRIATTEPFPLAETHQKDLKVGWIGFLPAGPVTVVQQVADANSIVLRPYFHELILVEGFKTAGLRPGNALPRQLPIWITGKKELPPTTPGGKPEKLWVAKQFFAESYVMRSSPATRGSGHEISR